MKSVREFMVNEDGGVMIEYGLIVALVSVAAIGPLTKVGKDLKDLFELIHQKLDAAF
jgi:pilus assembly protein Flp/PilA